MTISSGAIETTPVTYCHAPVAASFADSLRCSQSTQLNGLAPASRNGAARLTRRLTRGEGADKCSKQNGCVEAVCYMVNQGFRFGPIPICCLCVQSVSVDDGSCSDHSPICSPCVFIQGSLCPLHSPTVLHPLPLRAPFQKAACSFGLPISQTMSDKY